MASDSGTRGALLRYQADRLPVAYVLAMLAVHVGLFLWASPWVAAAFILPIWVMSTCVGAINHHHQHVNTFQRALPNRLYEVALALQTGISPHGWVLHHNLGHHANYLNQPPCPDPDESHWTRRDGTTMARLEYAVRLFLRHQIDIYRVGQRHPRQWRQYLWMKVPIYAITAAGLIIDPWMYVLVFVIPGALTLFHTCWATYEHHAGHHATGHHDASLNRESRAYNFLTCNLGLHTAHHMQPGLHWSLLPDLHAKIRPEIPDELVIDGFW